MRINLVLIIFCLLIILSSCSFNNPSQKDGIIYFNKFSGSVSLEDGKSIELDIITKMGFFYLFKDFLIVHDIYSTDKGIYILDKTTLSLIKKTGKIGRGPGEIGRYGNIYTDVLNNCFYVADFGKNKIWKFNIDSVINIDNYMPVEQCSFSNLPGIYPYDFIIKYDTLYFMSDLDYFMVKVFNNDSIEFLSKNKKEIVGLDNPKEYKRTFSTRITNIPDQSKYAFAFRYAEVITITDNNFVPLNSSYGRGKAFYGEEKFKDIIYYSHLKSDDKYLYAGYMNKPLIQQDVKYGNHKANLPQTIRIFTWEGEPVIELKCNDPFSDFYVDRLNNRVILFLTNKEKPIHIYEVDFKGLLN